MSGGDRTKVTDGSSAGGEGPLRGRVLAERYEVRAQLRNDAFTQGLLAFDQETEDRVVLRIVRSELLDAAGRASTYRALREAVGIGGRFLPGLLDADKDGESVFAVEPVPEGASLRDVLDRRIAEDRPMKESELLPLVTHLESALAAVPPPLRHGDVRAENVWVDPHRLWLMSAFIVPALPSSVLTRLLQKDSGLRRRMAPEMLRGIASDAGDRYGVGAILYEALTLKTPPGPGEVAGELPPTPVGEQVRALLQPSPGMRAKALNPLIEALAAASGLGASELDPGTFRSARRVSVTRSPSVVPPLAKALVSASDTERPPADEAELAGRDTQQTPALTEEDAIALLEPTRTAVDRHPRSVRTETAAPVTAKEQPRTRQDASGSLEDMPDVSSTAKLTPLSKKRARLALAERMETAGLDPRLVRAALERNQGAGHVDEEGDTVVPSSEDAIDPRLARAARGTGRDEGGSDDDAVPLDPSVPARAASDGTQELRLGDLEEAAEDGDGFSLDPSEPASAAPGGTQEIRLEDLEDAEHDEDTEYDEDAGFDEDAGYDEDAEYDEVPRDPSVAVQPAKGGTQELRLEDLEMQVQGDEQHAVRAARAPARDVGIEDLEEMRRRREAVPEDIQPIPRPRRDSQVGIQGPVLFDEAQPHRHEPAVVVRPPSEPPPHERRAPRLTEPMARADLARSKGAAAKRPSGTGNWGRTVIVLALLFGAAIIICGYMFARHQKSQAEELKRQRFQEHIERMRSGE